VEKEQFVEEINFDDTPTKLMDNSSALPNENILQPLRTGSKDYYEEAENNLMSGNNIDCLSDSDKNTEENGQYIFKDVKMTIVSNNEFLKQPKESSTHDFKANIKDDNPNILMNILAALRNYKTPKPLKTGSKGNYKLSLNSCYHANMLVEKF
jgi:hypothetical protein